MKNVCIKLIEILLVVVLIIAGGLGISSIILSVCSKCEDFFGAFVIAIIILSIFVVVLLMLLFNDRLELENYRAINNKYQLLSMDFENTSNERNKIYELLGYIHIERYLIEKCGIKLTTDLKAVFETSIYELMKDSNIEVDYLELICNELNKNGINRVINLVYWDLNNIRYLLVKYGFDLDFLDELKLCLSKYNIDQILNDSIWEWIDKLITELSNEYGLN